MTTSPITTAWESLPFDIRRAAEEAVGNLRPMSHSEILLVIAQAIAAERQRPKISHDDGGKRG
ncbi:hypothetical protein [Sinorhizobium medicae]|uniref:hypothetical protein n=1 Tax=Sinorhizobium medicae TaxID=110321 RepID=UPI000C79BE5D|nr:hypothetical protein [Sinorhizobium medicae]MDX0759424.1 hypothetical protein [Sinorhizobium medicae]MDX0796100.1 hypothetical protein [Sinorhizobium medicae]MDX0801686.1 hypothetical protein [Sinorhizobium medicae]MDX0937804.1 hypothetical protein [Sinorhizobium medicae]MDX0943443.1 hypothetical protein [Sinorhizobium medicae]